MSNIYLLPQLAPVVPGATSFSVTTSADWRDIIQFNYPTTSDKAGQPVPLNNIKFWATLRKSVSDSQILLGMSTNNGLLETDNNLGCLKFAVPVSRTLVPGKDFYMNDLPPNLGYPAVLDIVAQGLDADGQDLWTVSLCQQNGPLLVSIAAGLTDFEQLV